MVEVEAVEEDVEVSTDEEEEIGGRSVANPEGAKTCSCQDGVQSCPLDGKCLTECIVYKATLTADDGEVKTYIGLTEPPFKKRLYKHNADRRKRNLEKATAMSAYYWKKKDEGVEITSTTWEMLKKCHAYKPGGKSCDLCLSEKLLIMKNKDPRSLNVRSELLNTCRHRRKFKLSLAKTVA